MIKADIQWVILAGGRATRMQNQDKGLVALNNQALIEYVLNGLRVQANNIAINANRNIETYKQYRPVFSDVFADYPGPLAGIHAALTQYSKTEWIGIVPCDTPYIPSDLVVRFVQAHQQAQADIKKSEQPPLDILVAHDGDGIQPLFAVINTRILGKLTQFLEDNERKVRVFYQHCNTLHVDFSDAKDCFINLNSLEQLEEASK